MKIARTLLFAALGMLISAPPSEAILYLCPTDTLPPPGGCAEKDLNAASGEVIELYVYGSNGADVTIDVSGGWIEGFTPDPDEIVEYHLSPDSMRIQIAGVRTTPTDPNDLPTGAFRLGLLSVNASSGSFQAWVVAGSKGVVTGDAIEDINPAVIPEPAQWLMLVASSTVLAALGRRRSRLAKHRV
jgi:hypothetical protein